MSLVVGIDTGGTFTDLVAFDPDSGTISTLKTSSTPDAPGQAIVNALAEAGAAAAAVCLLFAYVNTEHEERVKTILEEELGDFPVSVSHEVAPVWREYERASTTIADAYLRPLFGRYVESLDAALRNAGMTRDWTIMKSNGGAMLASAAADSPVQTVMSGPAGGMTATERVAKALCEPNVLTLDMGGTSADVGI